MSVCSIAKLPIAATVGAQANLPEPIVEERATSCSYTRDADATDWALGVLGLGLGGCGLGGA